MNPGRIAAARTSVSPRPATLTSGTRQMIPVGERRIPVSRIGAGRPVLLLGGMCGSPVSWAPLARHLDGFECIGVDLPGDPDMAGGWPVLTMRRFTTLAVALLDELGIERANVLGYSFGGMVAQQIALDAPARVGRLVLVSTSCGLGGMPSNPMMWWRAMLEDLLAPTYGPMWFPMQWCHTMRRQFGEDLANGLRPRDSIQQFIAASGWSSLGWLARLPQQTLVITGSADALVPPENANVLASRIPGARTYSVRGGGHLCLFDRVAETGPVVADFLRVSEPAVDQAVQRGFHAADDGNGSSGWANRGRGCSKASYVPPVTPSTARKRSRRAASNATLTPTDQLMPTARSTS